MFGKRHAKARPALTIPMPRVSGKYDVAFRYIERMLGRRLSNIDAEAIIALIDQDRGDPPQNKNAL